MPSDTERAIGRLEGQFESMKYDIKTIHKKLDKQEQRITKLLEAHDERIGVLEAFKNKAIGIIAFLALGFKLAIDWSMSMLNFK